MTQSCVTQYRGIGVAEKRAQMIADGIPWPVCECHGEAMKWSKDAHHRPGGIMRCRVRERERQRKWKWEKLQTNPEYGERNRQLARERRARPEVRLARRVYLARPEQRLAKQLYDMTRARIYY